jgi:histidine triad (HIT) family protein
MLTMGREESSVTEHDCLFCKIVSGDVPATVVRESARTLAFRDINPQAPTHVLVIPTIHAEHLSDFAAQGNSEAAARLLSAAAEIGTRFGPGGYRVVFNEGRDAGQSVYHLHAHVLAGRPLQWPPG